MFRKLFIVATLFTSALSLSAQAALISTDWKVTGDNLASLDTETGLEWLDLNQTGGKSINEVKALLSTTYAGWRFPTPEEVYRLSAGLFKSIDALSQSASITHAAYTASELQQHALMGQNVAGYTQGLYSADGVSSHLFSSHAANRVYYNYKFSSDLDFKRVYEGVYLVSDGGTTLSSINDPTININNPNAPVNNMPPEPTDVPAPLGFVAFLMIGVGLMARKRHV